MTNSTQRAYKVLHNISMPFDYAVGDITGERGATCPPGNGTFGWSDDSTMGLFLLARLATHGAPRALVYVDTIAAMDLTFATHLYNPATGIYFHAYNGFNNVTSCCQWGVSGGYLIMTHVE